MTPRSDPPRPDPRAARDAPLAMSADAFRAAGHELVELIAQRLASLPDGPVTRAESPATVRAALDATATLPESGSDPRALLRSACDLLFDHSLFNGHPRFFGYITAAPAPIGILGDFLAAAVNANVGAWRLSPVASEIELQTLRWIAELVGYPADTGGLLVSGGNMANTVGLFAARAAAYAEVRTQGLRGSGTPQLVIYASAETHTWIQKAADLAGLGTDAIRWIPADDQQRMDPGALREAIRRDREAGHQPMMVVGTAGSVSTGAVDPLFEIADICKTAAVWFHIDGAYGGFAAAVPGAAPELAAIALADSVALDPHKWLYAPLEAGAVLVRDRERLRDAFAYHPPYYHFGVEATNFVDHGPQNSRGFRALKVWLALRHVGRAGYVKMIGDDIQLSVELAERVRAEPELELATQSLSITTFRYVPLDRRAAVGSDAGEQYLNRLNELLLERVQSSGEAFVSNAVVGGRYLLRACIVNFHTQVADITALPEIIVRLGRDEDRALRATSP
ncbi:MAG: aminotransferase class V-fold PLP-dependent enzyme [Deltaproteobacteria bacterium]|nr:aminotransferase class V-fold PLP-dependent enzyme [Deltaproteobacteria bacterium]